MQANCGLPSFEPTDTSGFEIETVDYDDDDLASTGLRLLQATTASANAGSNKYKGEKAPPKPPKSLNITRGAKFNGTNKEPKGPKVAKYDPDQGKQQKFKGGVKTSSDEPRCKKRYQQISVTAMGDLAVESTRILQTGEYTMSLQIGTSDFSAAYYLAGSVALAIFSLTAFL